MDDTRRRNGVVALQAEDASISTATITIKAIQVGKRQMTQSVFRQLPEADLVDEEDIGLLGIPWGWVNYHWGDLPVHHTHFIFQVGTRLFRDNFHVRESIAFSDPDSTPWGFRGIQRAWCSLVQGWHCARILEGWRPDFVPGKARWWNPEISSPEFMCSFCPRVPSDCSLIELVEDDENSVDGHLALQRKVKQRVIDELRKSVVEALGSSGDTAAFKQRSSELRTLAVDYCRRWDALMQQLRDVEQIFIAC